MMNSSLSGIRFIARSAAVALFCSATLLVGCDNKEEVLDIETPNGELEVERDRDTGELDVDVED